VKVDLQIPLRKVIVELKLSVAMFRQSENAAEDHFDPGMVPCFRCTPPPIVCVSISNFFVLVSVSIVIFFYIITFYFPFIHIAIVLLRLIF